MRLSELPLQKLLSAQPAKSNMWLAAFAGVDLRQTRGSAVSLMSGTCRNCQRTPDPRRDIVRPSINPNWTATSGDEAMSERSQFTRREVVKAGAMALGIASITSSSHAEEQNRWIDAHSHIWPAETDKFSLASGLTKKDLNPPSFTDDELMAIARPEGVERVVLIQHSVYHLFDNSYLLDAVKRHPGTFRVVGMVDDHKAGAGEEMKRLLPLGVTGFRITPLIRKEQPEKWLETDGMRQMWKAAAITKQSMCCLINPDQLSGVDAMCEQNPETPVVIDHFARIGVDGQMRDDDVAKLVRLARHKNTYVKVSAF